MKSAKKFKVKKAFMDGDDIFQKNEIFVKFAENIETGDVILKDEHGNFIKYDAEHFEEINEKEISEINYENKREVLIETLSRPCTLNDLREALLEYFKNEV